MFLYICKQLYKGNSIVRSFMHWNLKDVRIEGGVIDLGGAKLNEYTKILGIKKGQIQSFDMDTQTGSKQINFELDTLPLDDNSQENIFAFNLLEHIFKHEHLLREVGRCLQKNGTFLGFVPFLVNYHQDPHDFFRYTHESLEKLFAESNLSKIKITPVGIGPFMVNFNNIIFVFPKFIRPIVFIPYYLLDRLYKKLRPNITKRFPLGYLFLAKK
jgi:SAM-dependent methyltransferase